MPILFKKCEERLERVSVQHWCRQSDKFFLGGGNIHIFVFTECKNHRFQRNLFRTQIKVWLTIGDLGNLNEYLLLPVINIPDILTILF